MTQTLSTTCNDTEYKLFNKICEQYGYTAEEGLRLLVREVCDKRNLPMEYDFENLEAIAIWKQEIDSKDIEYIIPRNQFTEWVRSKRIMSYDGTGYMSDGTHKYYKIICNEEWLKAQPSYYKYIYWCNI